MKPACPTFLLLMTLLGACAAPGDNATVIRDQSTQVTTRTTVTTNSGAVDPGQTTRQSTQRPSTSREVPLSALPREGQQVLRQIAQGGPFRYAKDGSTFGNRERRLPQQPSGYYREYTVPTPGETDRGARRLICGGQPDTRTDDCYYTADHYRTFRSVQP
ncbi:ribonuclease domain-containing protein [Deinococcus radiotolerans]|uniref:Ribonuclease n=1 Tax=Deinococcus radiotolerans TaxID=1309407 RepID=A0ABQ2FEY9_9DEIO|nr:ribonuclease domain-containing protein [Deinococcus radiotolerans]GGK91766.1 ribonuclease [Deinococcus radiotolerans]